MIAIVHSKEHEKQFLFLEPALSSLYSFSAVYEMKNGSDSIAS